MKHIRFYIVYALLIMAALFIAFHHDVQVPAARPLTEIPQRLVGWVKIDDTYFSEAVLKTLRPTEYLYRVYADRDGHQVSLYVGYHGGGPDSGPIHSPKHCLPGSGWSNISERNKLISVGDKSIRVVEADYANGGQRELFLYWFQVKGAILTNEYALKLAEIRNSILYSRRDSAFVRISVSYRDVNDDAQLVVERFVRDFYPYINAVLPE